MITDPVPTASAWVWTVLILIAAISFWCQAIVTEERFVPALNILSTAYKIPDDIAGATLMAAGASSPELFSSIVALFITHSSLGLGTIVGSVRADMMRFRIKYSCFFGILRRRTVCWLFVSHTFRCLSLVRSLSVEYRKSLTVRWTVLEKTLHTHTIVSSCRPTQSVLSFSFLCFSLSLSLSHFMYTLPTTMHRGKTGRFLMRW
jgi:hypothetical protein